MRIMTRIKNIYERCVRAVLFRLHHVEVSSSAKFSGVPKFVGEGRVILGEDCFVASGPRANVIGGDVRCAFCVTDGAVIRIGAHSGISNSTIVCNVSVTIGEYVMIGGGCKIYDTDFHSVIFEQRTADVDTGIKAEPVVIEAGAFIGAHCIILKGVTIGARSVVGAGSVVTRDIPPLEIWAGNPARFIKRVSGMEKK